MIIIATLMIGVVALSIGCYATGYCQGRIDEIQGNDPPKWI